ncbi:MAG: bifunctional aldolase/short-chain dehydrogenase [Armatimonadota bacterium]
MENKWSEMSASEYIALYGEDWGDDLALRTYTSRLLGGESSLVLHGGGNTSVKGSYTDILGESIPAMFVKASGQDMAVIEPSGHPGLDLEYLKKLRALTELSDAAMVNEFRTHLFDSRSATPSIETLVHAFIPRKFIDHTHADAVLALTNQPNGEEIVKDALGSDIIVLEYVKAGFLLAKAAADAFDANPGAKGMVLMHHGIFTWGDTAKESYDAMIELVTKAEQYITERSKTSLKVAKPTPVDTAMARLTTAAPILRGMLTPPSDNPDKGFSRMILVPLVTREVLDFVDSDRGKKVALTAPLTADHLIRTKALPMWVDSPDYDDPGKLRTQISDAVEAYIKEYDEYLDRHEAAMPGGVSRFDSLPRVVLMPGLGALCIGKDAKAAEISRDITEHTLRVKSWIAAMGQYKGLSEDHLFDMEYYTLQHAKLGSAAEPVLSGETALVTGAAGAIGSGICRGLLHEGCHVAVTDLPGPNLDNLVAELQSQYGSKIIGIPIDVTNPDSVAEGVGKISAAWGGVDIAIVNAGVAHVSPLKDMDLAAFQRLEKINVEGTLLILREMARHFEFQATGGDIILVSTKNVFAPGATFGAYSATKAASHQLARIASLELAPIGVRVNMVAPDAVFSDGARKSGLWQEVGPGRMKARGLDEKGLEDYYQSRNLLKAKVTADHVANAVIFFASRQTPTTGATIPVDGGLPDATPR